MKKRIAPSVVRFPAAKQKRLDDLLDKNSEGKITLKEKARLEQLVAEAERLMVSNAKRIAAFSRTKQGKASDNAVAVTVWVQPEHAGR